MRNALGWDHGSEFCYWAGRWPWVALAEGAQELGSLWQLHVKAVDPAQFSVDRDSPELPERECPRIVDSLQPVSKGM